VRSQQAVLALKHSPDVVGIQGLQKRVIQLNMNSVKVGDVERIHLGFRFPVLGFMRTIRSFLRHVECGVKWCVVCKKGTSQRKVSMSRQKFKVRNDERYIFSIIAKNLRMPNFKEGDSSDKTLINEVGTLRLLQNDSFHAEFPVKHLCGKIIPREKECILYTGNNENITRFLFFRFFKF
jgi:hypothetical protein